MTHASIQWASQRRQQHHLTWVYICCKGCDSARDSVRGNIIAVYEVWPEKQIACAGA